MLPIVGFFIVLFSVVGGYLAMGGTLGVLWQPFEFLIIIGAGIGSFVVANHGVILRQAFASLGAIFRGPRFDRNDYLELLSMMHTILKISRSRGIMELETHIERPYDSPMLQKFPKFLQNAKAVTFLCDCLRIITLGNTNVDQLHMLMDKELATIAFERRRITNAYLTLSDAFPAIGIVAAVLGVIHTMGSMSEPPAVVGRLIAAALIGTFLGVFMSYGIVGPLARNLSLLDQTELQYLECIKETLLAYLRGSEPAVAIEQGRRTLTEDIKPSFQDIESIVFSKSGQTA